MHLLFTGTRGSGPTVSVAAQVAALRKHGGGQGRREGRGPPADGHQGATLAELERSYGVGKSTISRLTG